MAKTTRICGGKLFKGPGTVAGCPAAEEEQEQECIHIEQQKKNNVFTWNSKRRIRTRIYSHGTAKEEE